MPIHPGNRSRVVTVISFAASLFLPAGASATLGDHLWSKGWGTTSSHAVDCNAAGVTYAAGGFFSSIDFGGGPLTAVSSLGDFFIASFDPAGSHNWSRSIAPVTGSFRVDAVAAEPAGGFYVGGEILSGGSINFGGALLSGPNSMFLAKFDANGTHVWSASYGRGRIADIEATNAKVVVSGISNSSFVNFGGGVLTFNGGGDAVVAQLTSTGGHTWSKSAGNVFAQDAIQVSLTPQEDVVILVSMGGNADFGGGPLAADANPDFALAKFSPTGAHLWSTIYHGEFTTLSSTSVGGMDVASNGDIAIAGEIVGAADFGGGALAPSTAGISDVFVARFDASAAHQWSARYGSTSYDYAEAVSFDADGNLLVVGLFTTSINFGIGAVLGGTFPDFFGVLFDAVGSPLWNEGFGTPNGYESQCLGFMDAAGNIVMEGTGSNGIDFGGGPLSAGSFVLSKLEGPPLASDAPILQDSTTRLVAFPNPFRDAVTIHCSPGNMPFSRVEIFDVRGVLVRTLGGTALPIGTSPAVWDGKTSAGKRAPAGVYFVRALDASRAVTSRLVRN